MTDKGYIAEGEVNEDDPEYKEYRITWSIEVSASSHREAVEAAYETFSEQSDPDEDDRVHAPIFEVIEIGVPDEPQAFQVSIQGKATPYEPH